MEEKSYYGPSISRRDRASRSKTRQPKTFLVTCLAVLLALSVLFGALLSNDATSRIPSRTETVYDLGLLGLSVVYQHYDTVMPCNPCLIGGLLPGPHAWNDAAGPNGIYGDVDDCPHDSTYCAPASIAMIANYRMIPPPMNAQDDIYDVGKVMNGEIPGNKILETHGVGMFHGVGGTQPEVQISMMVTLGGPINQHNQNDGTALTAAQLETYIFNSHPVLWIDQGGWPSNQSSVFPPEEYRMDQGHAKVIGGYDDNDTAIFSDDLFLIYDPWPEYTDKSILPRNATMGPGGTYDPYWLPLNDVNLSDVNDVYLVDTFPDVIVPEFVSLLVPISGLALIAAVVTMRRRDQV